MKTPCIMVCVLDTKTGYCFGCGRTREEVAGWSNYSDEERDAIMEALPERLTHVERPPRRETKRTRMAREKVGRQADASTGEHEA